MTHYVFQLKGSWKGSWDGKGEIETNGLSSPISVDRSMRGLGIGTNPDELLISALASCYMITLGIRLKKESIAYQNIEINTEGTVTKKDGLHFEKVVHQVVIFLEQEPSQSLAEKIMAAARQAEKDCMIAKAVRKAMSC
ncbi:OsmC family protein [Terrilactibacillus sp. S3-3]|nr:OsmC family protein [Terrilactibacillus sp. S3-3]